MVGLNVSKHSVYLSDYALLVKYRTDYYTITLHRTYRQPGYVPTNSCKTKHAAGQISNNATVSNGRFLSSLSRTKRVLFELGMCNDWEYVAHLTFDGALHDRFNLPSLSAKIRKWVNNFNNLI